jgi:hypothetical protein
VEVFVVNELLLERTAQDLRLGSIDVVPQSNYFFSEFYRINMFSVGSNSQFSYAILVF